ncbi:hypothetical protein GE061_014377 [Apolygus lucorum]|uniref:HAUS augmin-like complex subunit 6 N-terminal domain-containing protein n=1 Tax=Apolygus lucorum TaxID=248454 RepID=A0A8S9XQG1_APOLU|nr:hypothetical protein GE061_014377 [Apolygus lucorum]
MAARLHVRKMESLSSSRCLVDENHNKLVALIVRLLFLLKKKFAFPNELRPEEVNLLMFESTNVRLMSTILNYVLNIINPAKCSLLVPNPLTVVSFAHFHQGVMKFLNQTFNELPHLKIDGLRSSTVASCSGSKFIEFLARLITITVQLVYQKKGVISIPYYQGSDRCTLMKAKADKALYDLLQLKHPSGQKSNNTPRHEEALEKLKVVEERVEARFKEVLPLCPPRYRESLERRDRGIAFHGLDTWKNDLKNSLDELSDELISSKNLSDAIGGAEAISTQNEPTRLEVDKLLNLKNEQIISKVAEDQGIHLFDGHAVSLPGFILCCSAIIEKFNTVIVSSKLGESLHRELKIIDTVPERVLQLGSEMAGKVDTSEEEIRLIKKECLEIQENYDKLLESGEIRHQYSYANSLPEPRLKIPSKPESQLTLSPGRSWQDELEDVKRKCSGVEQNNSVHTTPKLSRKRINTSSLSNLSRTVLEKQVWASTGSKGADVTVGEMFQGPLSSSSPMNSSGGRAVPSTRNSISDMLGDLSLNADLNEFLADISSMEDSCPDSPEDFQPVDAPSLETPSMPSEPAELPAPSAILVRRPRPSLIAIVKRYADLKNKIAGSD